MRKQYKGYFLTFLALATILMGAYGASVVFAKGSSQSASQSGISGSGKPAIAHMIGMHVVNMSNVPAETSTSSSQHAKALPFLTGVSAAVYAQRKAAAAQNKNATINTHSYANPIRSSGTTTPGATKGFQGMADSASTCPYFGGCQPPDQALAASTSYVFQGVKGASGQPNFKLKGPLVSTHVPS